MRRFTAFSAIRPISAGFGSNAAFGRQQAIDDARLDAQEFAFDPAVGAAGDTDVKPILVALEQLELGACLEEAAIEI